MIRKTILGTLTLLFLAAASPLAGSGKVGGDPEVEKQSKKAVEEQEEKTSELKKAVNEDVKKGLEKARKAVQALDEKKDKEALRLLKEAVGSFEIALAAEPGLAMVPVHSVVQAQELYIRPGDLKREISYAKDLLDEGRVQDARRVLLPLRSDISVSTTFLPMRTYPDAIRKAVRELAENRPEEAKETLAAAMNTLAVVEEVAAPIPLVAAERLVKEASELAKQKKDEALENLENAREQLEVGRLLGYLPEDGNQYSDVERRIKSVMKEIKGANRTEKLYRELKEALSGWLPWNQENGKKERKP